MRTCIIKISEKIFHAIYILGFIGGLFAGYSPISSFGWKYGWKIALPEVLGIWMLNLLFGILVYGLFEIVNLLKAIKK